MNYSTKFITICEKMSDKINSLDVNQKVDEYHNLYSILNKIEPDSLEAFLNNTGINSDLGKWKKASHQLYEKIESIGILPNENKIKITVEDGEIEEDLTNINDYLLDKLNLKVNSWEYNLALSIFLQPSHYEFFQVVHSFILK